MMSVPYALYAENSNVNYDSISTILSNDTSYSIYLQCVDMGVSLYLSGPWIRSKLSFGFK